MSAGLVDPRSRSESFRCCWSVGVQWRSIVAAFGESTITLSPQSVLPLNGAFPEATTRSPFEGSTAIALPIVCTYDLEVTAGGYFAALTEGEVPLEFLFSGSLFFETEAGALQTTRIAWDREAAYRLPVSAWRAAMARHFPDSAWLRLGSASFDRLCTYKARHAFPSFDAALDALLPGEGAP